MENLLGDRLGPEAKKVLGATPRLPVSFSMYIIVSSVE